MHFTDVVHADIPFKTFTVISMGKASGGVMLFKNRDFLAQ